MNKLERERNWKNSRLRGLNYSAIPPHTFSTDPTIIIPCFFLHKIKKKFSIIPPHGQHGMALKLIGVCDYNNNTNTLLMFLTGFGNRRIFLLQERKFFSICPFGLWSHYGPSYPSSSSFSPYDAERIFISQFYFRIMKKILISLLQQRIHRSYRSYEEN